MDIFPPSRTAEQVARDELYAAQKRAIDKDYDAMKLHKMQTQAMLEIEEYFLMYNFRDKNLIWKKQQIGFMPV